MKNESASASASSSSLASIIARALLRISARPACRRCVLGEEASLPPPPLCRNEDDPISSLMDMSMRKLLGLAKADDDDSGRLRVGRISSFKDIVGVSPGVTNVRPLLVFCLLVLLDAVAWPLESGSFSEDDLALGSAW